MSMWQCFWCPYANGIETFDQLKPMLRSNTRGNGMWKRVGRLGLWCIFKQKWGELAQGAGGQKVGEEQVGLESGWQWILEQGIDISCQCGSASGTLTPFNLY